MLSWALGRFLLFTTLTAPTIGKLECKLDPKLKTEIHGYQNIVDQIVKAVSSNDTYTGKLYKEIEDFVDGFGPRISGSHELEKSIDYLIERQKQANLTVTTQQVKVPKWERGEEFAEMVKPRKQILTILGLGNSKNTPDEGITAEVLVIMSFQELNNRKEEVLGKIVLFNAEFTNYNEAIKYQTYGPNNASAMGAVAVLVRSITPFSINSPHTGITLFEKEKLRIPAAAISLENANLIQRLTTKGHRVAITLKMGAKILPPSDSRNVIADITGKTKPTEYVVISGHSDSWDVGQGAVDGASGAFLAWHSLALINYLNLPAPARTLRAIIWTGAEFNHAGATAYRAQREKEIENWVAAFGSDQGVFQAKGIAFSGNEDASCIMQEITEMLGAVNGTVLHRKPNVEGDVDLFRDLGIPVGEPYLVPNNLFWYQHSAGDWIDVLQPEDLDQNLAIFASTAYILANMSEPLHKSEIIVKPSNRVSTVNAAIIPPMLLPLIFLSSFIILLQMKNCKM